MQVNIDKTKCTRCGKCCKIAPDVFKVGQNATILVEPITLYNKGQAIQAFNECPEVAINIDGDITKEEISSYQENYSKKKKSHHKPNTSYSHAKLEDYVKIFSIFKTIITIAFIIEIIGFLIATIPIGTWFATFFAPLIGSGLRFALEMFMLNFFIYICQIIK